MTKIIKIVLTLGHSTLDLYILDDFSWSHDKLMAKLTQITYFYHFFLFSSDNCHASVSAKMITLFYRQSDVPDMWQHQDKKLLGHVFSFGKL